MGSTAKVGGKLVKFVFCSSADYLKNASRLDLVARSRALITIKLESRRLLSRDAPRRAEGGARPVLAGSECVVVI